MATSGAIDSVLLLGFGGPTRADEVRPFLDNVLRGRSVPPERYEEVVHHYERMGGRSPYNDLTLRQAGALRAALARDGVQIPVEVGMRNWSPYVDDAMRRLAEAGARRTLAFILAAHRSEASWDRYQANVREAQAKLDGRAPEVVYPETWHAHPMFIRAAASRVSDALARLTHSERASAQLVFTAHSIPAAMAEASGYVEQLMESARLVADSLGITSWQLAYQSRSGSPRERWLEPDVRDVIRKLDSRAAVVMPIGFLCDHIEVLYDLDIEAAGIARECGVRMERAATVGDHPDFIAMIAAILGEYRA